MRTDGPFVLRSGETSDWYIDARQTTFSGEGARIVGAAVAAEVPEAANAVGGMTMGADPIAIATAMVASEFGRTIAAFSIRKSEKDHGTGGRLVGPVGPGDAAVALEDTTTTGAALVEAIDALLAEGVHVIRAIALVDRSRGATRARVEQLGVPYIALTTPADLGVET